ncbi:DNA binding [Phytophthora ramorum]
MRDNLDEVTGRPSSAGAKLDTADSSRNGATYASNKRVRAKKKKGLDQIRKELAKAKAYCDKRVMIEWIDKVWAPDIQRPSVLALDCLKTHASGLAWWIMRTPA